MSITELVHASRRVLQRDKLLRIPAVEDATGVKKSTIYALMKKGEFPQCVQVTARCVAWPESKILEWVQDRISKANPSQAETQGNEGVKP